MPINPAIEENPLLEKYIAKVGEMRKTPLNEERESVAEIHNAALDEVQSLLPELIKEVVEELNWRNWGLGNTPSDSDILDNYEKHLASLAEPNIK